MVKTLFAFFVGFILSSAVQAQEAVFQTKSLVPETALKAAKAALDACRKEGFQVAVAVVDRSGLTQVLLRDRFAGAHTPEVAQNKAWTEVGGCRDQDGVQHGCHRGPA